MNRTAQYVPTPRGRVLGGDRAIKPSWCCIIAAQIVEIAAPPIGGSTGARRGPGDHSIHLDAPQPADQNRKITTQSVVVLCASFLKPDSELQFDQSIRMLTLKTCLKRDRQRVG
jgi:hypothetical protein